MLRPLRSCGLRALFRRDILSQQIRLRSGAVTVVRCGFPGAAAAGWLDVRPKLPTIMGVATPLIGRTDVLRIAIETVPGGLTATIFGSTYR